MITQFPFQFPSFSIVSTDNVAVVVVFPVPSAGSDATVYEDSDSKEYCDAACANYYVFSCVGEAGRSTGVIWALILLSFDSLRTECGTGDVARSTPGLDRKGNAER